MEKVPFDYDKYAADRSAWKLFTNEGDEIVYIIKSPDEHETYPFKGIIVDKDGMPHDETWQENGQYFNDPNGEKNISHMEPVHKEKPAETKMVSSLSTRLRNIYYDKNRNCIRVGAKAFELWTDAMKSSVVSCMKHEGLEHLCIVNLEDHPQIREMLIAKGLTEVTMTTEFKEEV